MKNITKINEKRREKRRKQTAEVFTPDTLVNEILDKLPKNVWQEGEEHTVLDPTCGNGQFLIWVLLRKLLLNTDRCLTSVLTTVP